MSAFIGIDPGLTGGIAVIDDDARVWPMPTMPKPKGRGRQVDGAPVASWLTTLHAPSAYAVLEQQHTMPQEGRISAFTNGGGFRLLEGILIGLGIRHEIVPAKEWQSWMLAGVSKTWGNTKTRSIIRAGQLFPRVSLLPTKKSRKPSHGMSDALLIAAYGRRMAEAERTNDVDV